MPSFEDVVSKAKTVAGAAGKKTSDFIEVTRLKIEVAELEKNITSALEGLGRLVYDARKSGEDVSSMVEECVVSIDEYKEKIDLLRDKIDSYRYTVHCKNCGASNPNDATFCKKCGATIASK